MKRGEFGKPTPLPGQPGYRRTRKESDRLAAETDQMEQRLSALKAQVVAERENMEIQKSGAGDARWRSGSSNLGSLRSYAADVNSGKRGKTAPAEQVDEVVRREPAAGSGVAAARRPLRKSQCETWTVRDVCFWLASIGLKAHQKTFFRNKITGELLLELESDDFDYLKITALGDRKVLRRSIDDLKAMLAKAQGAQSGAATAPEPEPAAAPQAAPRSPPHPAPEGASRPVPQANPLAGQARAPAPHATVGPLPVDAGAAAGEAKEGGKRVHWSHVAPLSEQPVAHPGSQLPANLADGAYDEAASRQAFQDAVAEWRAGSGKPIALVKAGEGDGGMWTNPLAGAGSSAAAESAAAGPSAAGPEDSSSDGSGSPHRPTRSRRGIRMVYPGQSRSERGPGAGAEGGKAAAGDDTLLDGALDVDAEHERFVTAVQEWRSGRRAPDEDRVRAALPASVQWLHSEGPQQPRSAEELARAHGLDLSAERDDAGDTSRGTGGEGKSEGEGKNEPVGKLALTDEEDIVRDYDPLALDVEGLWADSEGEEGGTGEGVAGWAAEGKEGELAAGGEGAEEGDQLAPPPRRLARDYDIWNTDVAY